MDMSQMSSMTSQYMYTAPMSKQSLPPPTFGEWLEEQLNVRKWSRPRLAREIDYSPDTVAAWVRGRRVPEERACDAIALAFNMDHNEVRRLAGRPESPQSHFVSASGPANLGGSAIFELTSSAQLEANPRGRSSVSADLTTGHQPIDIRYIPIIGTAAADTLRASWGPGDLYPVLRADVQGVGDPVMMVVSGDCMEPRIHSGDLVILDTTATPEVGEVVAVRVDDDVTLKELWAEEDDEIVLRAIKAGYPPIRIPREDQGAQLVGVVRRWIRSGRV